MFVRSVVPVLAWFAIASGSLPCVPAAFGQTAATDGSPAPGQAVIQERPAGTAPRADDPSPPDAVDASPAAPIATRYAYFVPARFGDLPGWRTDDLAEAWKAFRASCNVLASRTAWSGPCRRASRVNPRDDDVRRFLEREFTLYQIHNKDQSPAGVITGYYEPLLHGSRRYGEPYVHPVYGVPADLLYLDSRSIPRTNGDAPVFARIEGRAVIPACAEPRTDPTCRGPYVLDIGRAKPDIRDKRLRVRVDGQRIVPYYTRAEIEQGAMATEPVILWVDNRAALYSLHVQGSGKVRLPDGQIVRLAYGEQNGHPFTPPIRKAHKARPRSATVLTRGIEIPMDEPEEEVLDEDEDVEDASSTDVGGVGGLLLRGGQPAGTRSRRPAPGAAGANADEEMSPEVARMVELLLKGTESQGPQRIPVAPGSAAEKDKRPAAGPAPSMAAPPPASTNDNRPLIEPAPSLAKSLPTPADGQSAPIKPGPIVAKSLPAPADDNRPVNEPASVLAKSSPAVPVARPFVPAPAPLVATPPLSSPLTKLVPGPERPSPFSTDPSYVFFRQIPDDDGGPRGALGVPLTPGRSVAVDPRTTPLGAPVFIATTGPSPGSGVSRLMLAQDTGGAIRGAVRADYFWGFGPSAGERASRMKEFGRMWLLLPKDLALSVGATGITTRGIDGGPGAGDAECLIPDPDLCVE